MAWIVEIGDEFLPEFNELGEKVRTEILAHSRLLRSFLSCNECLQLRFCQFAQTVEVSHLRIVPAPTGIHRVRSAFPVSSLGWRTSLQ